MKVKMLADNEIIEAKRLYELIEEELKESIGYIPDDESLWGKKWYICSRKRKLLCIYVWKWSGDCRRINLITTYSNIINITNIFTICSKIFT